MHVPSTWVYVSPLATRPKDSSNTQSVPLDSLLPPGEGLLVTKACISLPLLGIYLSAFLSANQVRKSWHKRIWNSRRVLWNLCWVKVCGERVEASCLEGFSEPCSGEGLLFLVLPNEGWGAGGGLTPCRAGETLLRGGGEFLTLGNCGRSPFSLNCWLLICLYCIWPPTLLARRTTLLKTGSRAVCEPEQELSPLPEPVLAASGKFWGSSIPLPQELSTAFSLQSPEGPTWKEAGSAEKHWPPLQWLPSPLPTSQGPREEAPEWTRDFKQWKGWHEREPHGKKQQTQNQPQLMFTWYSLCARHCAISPYPLNNSWCR